MKVQNRFILSSALALAALAGSTSAAPELRDLGFGWQVLLPDADVVDIVVDEAASNSSQLVLEKFATFMDVSALDLVFTQTGPGAAPRIIITDEYIGNQTGQSWVSFTNSLVDFSNGSAVFNVGASAGLSIAPFTTTTYQAGNTSVTYAGGMIPNAGFWFPGVAAGALVVDVTFGAGNTSFTLREIPAVPTPGSTALGAAAIGLLAARRRR
ncbi:MAG: hypothetical protein AB7K52_09195 [Phycisphaerales bacterium]